MKKFIALLLIFSLLSLSVNLYAKKRGAKLIITKKDGQKIEGELIAVKKNSLLLLMKFVVDITVDIKDIKVIKIVKKSQAGKGVLYGWSAGGLIGVIYGSVIEPPYGNKAGVILFSGILFAIPGALIGISIGTAAGADKTFQIEGMTYLEIRETMDYLRKKARVRDYK